MLGSACAQRAAAPGACLNSRAPQQQQQAALAFRRAVGGGAAAALRPAAAPSSSTPLPSRGSTAVHAVAAPERPVQQPAAPGSGRPPLKVIVAGGGIGGLVLAVGLLKRGFDVTVLERDMTAIRGEGKYRGPIQVRACCGGGSWGRAGAVRCVAGVSLRCRQPLPLPGGAPHPLTFRPVPPAACQPPQIQSNALGALEALDERVAQRVYEEGCITGDRINGLCDGVTGDW